MRIIKTHQLSNEEVFPYFAEHIRYGNTLSEKVLERIDFHLGIFFTILPEEIYEERLFWFDCPIIPAKEHIVLTTDRECSDFILKFLQKDRRNCAIVEDVIRRLDDPHVVKENIKLLPFENEVYYLLNGQNTVEEIYRTLRSCAGGWHSLIVLTSLENTCELEKLTNATLKAVCDNSKYVIASAYDEDSYIFWQKR